MGGSFRHPDVASRPLFRLWSLVGLLLTTTATLADSSPQANVELPCNPDTLLTRLHYEGMVTRMADAQASKPNPGSPFMGLFQTPTIELAVVSDSATCVAAGTALQAVDSTLTPGVVTVLRFGSSGYSVHTSLDEDAYFFSTRSGGISGHWPESDPSQGFAAVGHGL